MQNKSIVYLKVGEPNEKGVDDFVGYADFILRLC